MEDIISLQTGNLLSRQISKTRSTNQMDIFANRFFEQIAKIRLKIAIE